MTSPGTNDIELVAADSLSDQKPTSSTNASGEARSTTINAQSEPGVDENHEAEHGHGDTAHHVRNTEPWRIHTCIAKWPCLSCMFMCGWFIVCGAIVFSIPGLLQFTTDVPFYIRDNAATTMFDAFKAGRNDANWEKSGTGNAELQQESLADVDLNIVFVVKDGETLMTEEYLSLMEEIESRIKNTNGYQDYCWRAYSGSNVNNSDPNSFMCARETSLTNFFDASYFIGAMNQSYSIYPSFGNTKNFFLPSALIDSTVNLTNKNYSEEFVDIITTYWAGYGNGEGPAGDYQPKYYNGQQMPAQFHYEMKGGIEWQNYSLSNVFAKLSDQYFAYQTPLDTDVHAAISLFSFGTPLNGYSSSSDDIQSQRDEIGKWCYDELHAMFTEFQQEHKEKFDFYWSCGTMGEYYSMAVLMQDATLMALTFLSVYILMIINTGSLWLGSYVSNAISDLNLAGIHVCGMVMIFMNFLPALLLYGGVTQISYFGTLCVLAMFIILAIGADDIFVLVDTWEQYRTAAPDEPMDKRMTATLRHAGKVMATTSASTCFSFIGNTTSSFPAVYTFGAFAAWLVFVNYCAVCLFYPTVLAVHEKYFFTPKLKKACCCPKQCADKGCATSCCCGKFPNLKPDDEDTERGIDKFCMYRYFPFILKWRNNILMVTALFFLIFFFLATQITPDPDPPQFYPDGNNYQEYGSALTDNFASETDQQQTVYLTWGIEGINRDGTDPTDGDDIGQVIYAENSLKFILSPDEQQYLAQISDDLLCVYSSYSCRYTDDTYYDLLISDPAEYGGEDVNVLKSPIQHFRTWIYEDSSARPENGTIQETLNTYNLSTDHPMGLNVSDFDDCEWGKFPVEGDVCFMLLFYYLWPNDDLPTSNPDYSAGTTNYDYWKDYLRLKECTYNNETGECWAGVELKFLYIGVLTEAKPDTSFREGISAFDSWQQYKEDWKENVPGVTTQDQFEKEFVDTPTTMESIMVTDWGWFSYYFLQEKIIQEAAFGIALSLGFAFIILTLATQNWIMAMYSVMVIFAIVMCVIGFTVANGWKLGVIEAIIYVMVVGMSVDYVVHLSEAYLASGKEKRVDRSRRMLGIVGSAVLSGAMSTMIGIFWLLFATIMIFLKFGAFIFFLIACSCFFSLVSFSAAMSAFGPEGEKGNIRAIYRKCKRRCTGEEAALGNKEQLVLEEKQHSPVSSTESQAGIR